MKNHIRAAGAVRLLAGRLLRRTLVGASLLFAGTCTAAVPPDVQRGLDWLQAQVGVSGALATETQSVATTAQARTEALEALLALGASSASLATLVAASEEDSTEHLARRIVSLAAAGRPTQALVDALKQRRNPDGGFGDAIGARSNPLDSAWTLLAFRLAGFSDGVVLGAALEYVAAAINDDGGYGVPASTSEAFVTAYGLLALEAYHDAYQLGTPLLRAQAWLQGQQTGGAYADVMHNAVAVLALSRTTSDPARYAGALAALRAAQRVDGSWDADPYLTAIALRALASYAQPPPLPTTGELVGRVIDAASLRPVEGATVTLGATIAPTTAQGDFSIGPVPPGSYTVNIAKTGFAGAHVQVTIVAGAISNIGTVALALAPSTAVLRGRIADGSSGLPLESARVAVSREGTAVGSTLTRQDGSFELVDMSPGAVFITVSLEGYRPAQASAQLAGGTAYTFSPALYPETEPTPDTASLSGRIIDANSGLPVAGTRIAVGGSQGVTGAAGTFVLADLASGAVTIEISAQGFQGVTLQASLVAGSNALGDVRLAPLASAVSLAGVVSNAASGAAIAGALLTVQGQNLQSTADATGRYRIEGIPLKSFVLLAEAPGYVGKSIDVTVSEYGEYAADVALTLNDASGVTLEVTTNLGEYPPYSEIEIRGIATNASADQKDLSFTASIVDAQRNLLHDVQALPFLHESPVPATFAIPPQGTLAVAASWYNQGVTAGNYRVIVKARDARGIVVAEGATLVQVLAQRRIGGNLELDPPILQAGTGQAVSLLAGIGNVGNLDIDAGQALLEVTLASVDTSVNPMAPARIWPLFDGSPLNQPTGAAFDASGNLYSMNGMGNASIFRITPGGTATLVKTASFAGDAFTRDASGNLYVLARYDRLERISPAGARTIITSDEDWQSAIDVDAAGNMYIVSGNEKIFRLSPTGQKTTILQRGLSVPSDGVTGPDGSLYVTSYGDNKLARIDAQGRIGTFVGAGLSRPRGIASDNTDLVVANSGGNNLLRVSAQGNLSTVATGLSSPHSVARDSAGNFYVTNAGNNSVAKISAAGSVEIVAESIGDRPRGIAYDAAGALYVANENGTLTRAVANGDVETLSASISTTPRDVEVGADGAAYVANYLAGTVSRVADGATTSFASGLSSPYGVALDDAGTLYVSETGADRISRLLPGGVRQTLVRSFIDDPQSVAVDALGDIYVLNSGSLAILPGGGTGRTLVTAYTGGGTASGIAAAPGGGVLVLVGQNRIVRVTADGVQTSYASFAQNFADLAIDASGTVFLTDASLGKVWRVDAAKQPVLLANVASQPKGIAPGPDGNLYAALATGPVVRITMAGVVTAVASVSSQGRRLTVAPDGTLYVIGSSGTRLSRITPAGAVSTLVSGLTSATGIAMSPAGQLLLTQSSLDQMQTYTTAGALVGNVAGFDAPYDLEWTGDGFVFSVQGNRVYELQNGGNPRLLASTRADYLAWNGSAALGIGAGVITHIPMTGVATTWFSTSLFATPGGIALAPDGLLSFVDGADTEIFTINAAKVLVGARTGLANLMGIAVTASGELFVASNGTGKVVRISADRKIARAFATPANAPRGVKLAPDGSLYVNSAYQLYRVTMGGSISTLASGGTNLATATLFGSELMVIDMSGLVSRVSGGTLTPFAAGLSGATGIAIAPDGALYFASRWTGVVHRYRAGLLEVVASGLQLPESVAIYDATRLVVSSSENLYLVDMDDGAVTDFKAQAMLRGLNVADVAVASDGTIAVAGLAANAIYVATAPLPISLPEPGTVVLTRSAAHAALSLTGGMATVDLGQWVPPYAGDYRLVLRSGAGADGTLVNTLHVGPHAMATIAADREAVAPGAAAVGVQVQVLGADFTSLSKVNAANLRKVAAAPRPATMGADGAGNIYLSDSTTVRRHSPDGTVTPIYTGTLRGFGTMPIDAGGFAYVGNSSRQIVRVAGNGSGASVLATLPSAAGSIASLVINSREELFVSTTTNDIYRVLKTGAVSKLPTPAFSSIYSMTIDGADRLYVLDSSNAVTAVDADGKGSVVLTDPVFEYEGMPITGDCAENLFVSPRVWSEVGATGPEEYVLAQVFGRSKAVAQVFNGNATNPKITDIDHLIYDRFGGSLIFWTDVGGNPIYRVPITCGAISVDFSIVLPPGQSASGFSVAPNATLHADDGSTELVWNLKDVDSLGRSIGFETVVQGLRLGDRRPIAQAAFLVFKNSFAAGDVRVPVALPTVTVRGDVEVSLAADRISYPPRTDILADVGVQNLSAFDLTGELLVELADAQGRVVAPMLRQTMQIPSGTTVRAYASMNTGTSYAGDYRIRAAFADLTGLLQDQTELPIAILAAGDPAPVPALTAALVSDRQTYGAYAPVKLQARVANTTANILHESLLATVTVASVAGDTVFTGYRQIAQLAPGGLIEAGFSHHLDGSLIGPFLARVDVTDAFGRVLASAQTAFDVVDDYRASLTGEVEVAVAEVRQGDPQSCTDRLTNRGVRSIAALAIRQTLASLATGQAVSVAEETVSLAAGASQSSQRSIQTGPLAPGDYACALEIRSEDAWVPLAHVRFRVLPERISVSAAVSTDRASYPPSASVEIEAQTRSRMQYAAASGLRLRLAIAAPDGSSAFSVERTLVALEPGAMSTTRASYSFANAEEGRYVVDDIVMDAGGVRVAAAESSYEVRKTAAEAIGGEVQVRSSVLVEGENQACTDLVHNSSIYRLGVTLRQRVLGGAGSRTLASDEVQAEVPAGGQHRFTREFDTQGYEPGEYACTLELRVGESWRSLAEATFKVKPAIRIDVGMALGERGRLLVLTDDPDRSQDPPPLPDPIAQRMFLDRYLDALGGSHTVVSDAAGFARELRSGSYDAYALLSEQVKLDEVLQKELREAVFRGEGLIEAGGHDQRNPRVDDALGIKAIGTHASTGGVQLLPVPPFEAAYADLLQRGRNLRTELAGATAAGHYLGADSRATALTVFGFGGGRSVHAGFDLLAEATAQGDEGLYADMLGRAIALVAAPATAPVTGRVVPIRITVANRGIAVPLRIDLALPQGVSVVDGAAAQRLDGILRWELQLEEDQTRTVEAWLRLPSAPGPASFEAAVFALSAGTYVEQERAQFELALAEAPDLDEALVLAAADPALRQVRLWLDKAQRSLTSGDYARALAELGRAADEIARHDSAGGMALRTAIGEAMRDAGARL